MLVGGAGQVKLTKDGKVLLDEMPVQHPTAVLVARTATAQDEITGDGTTSSVLFTAALLQQAERCLQEGMAPRHLVDGMEIAREATLKFLDEFKTEFKQPDREILTALARTSQRTKVHAKLADHLADIVVNALLCVRVPGQPLDLNMVEIMHMRHKSEMDTRFVSGLVLDHGARHPNSAKR
jgi:T-complex protein 1 subunit zeta